ncbi:YrdB family protein [Paenibacillus humicola]|uniref:YrdB family protein n=1 Tax=Paenibacillus humicola TaxID=3110540 RepID=UPI00237B3161|nr:YrdB family protein [Paenibacillus humicola]
MSLIVNANLALRFLLELSAVASLCYWGFHNGSSLAAKTMLGIGSPLLAAVAWGAFVSPKAAIPVSAPLRLLVEVALFLLAAAALFAAGRDTLGSTLVILAFASRILMFLLN